MITLQATKIKAVLAASKLSHWQNVKTICDIYQIPTPSDMEKEISDLGMIAQFRLMDYAALATRKGGQDE